MIVVSTTPSKKQTKVLINFIQQIVFYHNNSYFFSTCIGNVSSTLDKFVKYTYQG